MAHKGRHLQRGIKHNRPGLTILHGDVAIAANGTATVGTFPGLTSVTRSAEGKFVFNLAEEWSSFCNALITIKKATEVEMHYQVTAEAVANASPTITVWFSDADGVIADPASSTLLCTFILDQMTAA